METSYEKMMSLKERKGIRLDLGCGANKQQGFLGMDIRQLPGVDIVQDIEQYPWPLSDGSCVLILCSHVVEHIKPWLSITFLDECWRLLEEYGELAISTPYPGSRGFWQDPTHCNGWSETTFQYFDPSFPLYGIYKPKPWKIKKGFPVWQVTGNLEVLLTKLPEEEVEGKQALATGGATLGISVADKAGIKDKMGG
jgi:SAM-dependent methyltransferase